MNLQPINATDPDGEAIVAVVVPFVIGGTIACFFLCDDAIEAAVGQSDGEVFTDNVFTNAAENLGEVLNDVSDQSGAEHTSGARPSTQEKHEKGRARKAKDRGGEKGDGKRGPNRKRPKGPDGKPVKGPWPPKGSASATETSTSGNELSDSSKELEVPE